MNIETTAANAAKSERIALHGAIASIKNALSVYAGESPEHAALTERLEEYRARLAAAQDA